MYRQHWQDASMRLDKENVPWLHAQLQEHLDQFAKNHGFRITLGRATFTDKLAEFKVSVAPIQEDGSAASPESEAFERYCCRYDLQPSDLGRTFQSGFKSYKIVGLNPRSPAYPLLCQDEAGVIFKFPAIQVKQQLAAQAHARS